MDGEGDPPSDASENNDDDSVMIVHVHDQPRSNLFPIPIVIGGNTMHDYEGVQAAPPAPVANSDVVVSAPSAAMEIVVDHDGYVVNAANNTRKRKSRSKSKSKTPPKKSTEHVDDNDDGLTCPICLDHWEMSGVHRLSSLKCGHLFGHSCIKRWLQQQTRAQRSCPSCKSPATPRDIRFLYAKRILAIDNSEEQTLREQLKGEKAKYDKLRDEYGVLSLEVAVTRKKYDELNAKYEDLVRKNNGPIDNPSGTNKLRLEYKIYTEKNIEIAKEPSCRALTYGKVIKTLAVSQKSIVNLFPGYGIGFIDIKTFRQTNFLHVGRKQLRDICFDEKNDLLATSTMEKSVKLFSVRDRNCVSVFEPCEQPIWTCAIDNSKDFIFLGSQLGSTYLYDKRDASMYLEEFKIQGDFSPVINICPVSATKTFPLGGFLICKLQSLWFHEFTAAQDILSTKLPIEGPFISVSYDSTSGYVLVTTRPTAKQRTSQFIIALLIKLGDSITVDVVKAFHGSRTHCFTSRSSQLRIGDDTIVAGYLKDIQALSMWSVASAERICATSFPDTVLDTCGVQDDNNVFLAATTETKCRLMRIIQTAKKF